MAQPCRLYGYLHLAKRVAFLFSTPTPWGHFCKQYRIVETSGLAKTLKGMSVRQPEPVCQLVGALRDQTLFSILGVFMHSCYWAGSMALCVNYCVPRTNLSVREILSAL